MKQILINVKELKSLKAYFLTTMELNQKSIKKENVKNSQVCEYKTYLNRKG